MSGLIHRVREYVMATGALASQHPVAVSLDAGAPLNDTPSISGSFEYINADDTRSPVSIPCELAIEVSADDGETWVEPPNMRFSMLRESSDLVSQGAVSHLSGVGMAWQLNKAIVRDTTGEPLDTSYRRVFETATPGGILAKLLDEAQDRGVLTWLDFSSFDSLADSDGTAWPESFSTIAYDIGTTLWQIINTMTSNGLIDWHMDGRELKVYVADTYLNNDLSGSVTLREGVHFTEGGRSSTAEEMASQLLIRGDGESTDVVNAFAYEPWGPWEASIGASGTDDPLMLQLMAELHKVTAGDVRNQKTLQIATAADPTGPQPFVDFAVGDTINTICNSESEDLRIHQLTLTSGDNDGTRVAIVVGDRLLNQEVKLTRRLAGISGGISGEVGSGVIPTPELDPSIPDTPAFGAAFTNVYQSIGHSPVTKAQVQLTWSEPLNQDGSSVLDGSHYEIRYRPNATLPYHATWEEVSDYTWDELYSWGQPLIPAITSTEWVYVRVPWDVTQTMIQELTPRVVYEFQIRATDKVDQSSPWSASFAVTAAKDNIPPSTPAAPAVAGNRMNIQIVHTLGIEEGGTYNLEADVSYLEVHVVGQFDYPVDSSTLVGVIPGIGQMLAAGVPAVGSFHHEAIGPRAVKVVAVDSSGNRSNASKSNDVTALLIDDAHISDLSVSKVTAGTINADWILAASIKTALDGQRLELANTGLVAYDANGELTINLSSDPQASDQFISFKSGPDTLASIDSEGKASFQEVYAPSIYVAGQDIMLDVIDRRPRGIIAYGESSESVQGRGANTERGYLELAFEAEEGRSYMINFFGEMESTSATAGERYIYKIRDGLDQEPSVTSTEIASYAFGATLSAGLNDAGYYVIMLRCPEDITVGMHRLLWTFMARLGTGTLRGDESTAYFFVEDIGPSDLLENLAILNDGGVDAAAGGGGTSPTAPPPVKKTYTKRYYATWSGSYRGTGSRITYYGSEVIQGNSPYTSDGNVRGLIGFPSSMKTDLAGSTVKSIKFTAYANHWHYNAGGTAVIGWHDYSSRPGTWSGGRVHEDEVRSSSWPKPGQRTVTLSASTWGAVIKSGTCKGIALGPGASDSPTYYGRFNGNGMAREPYLDIVYVK